MLSLDGKAEEFSRGEDDAEVRVVSASTRCWAWEASGNQGNINYYDVIVIMMQSVSVRMSDIKSTH